MYGRLDLEEGLDDGFEPVWDGRVSISCGVWTRELGIEWRYLPSTASSVSGAISGTWGREKLVFGGEG